MEACEVPAFSMALRRCGLAIFAGSGPSHMLTGLLLQSGPIPYLSLRHGLKAFAISHRLGLGTSDLRLNLNREGLIF